VSREYPARPIIAVGGVVFMEGRVVLIKRRHPPLQGRWSLPGGGVQVGETLREAMQRELREEIGIDTRVGPLIDLFDHITRDPDGRVQYHFVLADYLCHQVGGRLRPGSDAESVAVADPDNLLSYDLTDKTLEVIQRAATLR
jgi:8-oxo-dGTP diphosphatase